MDPGNLESLLPWQLAREGLEHPAGGPCELCLGPLRLFRDAARLAESMGAGNAVADAASDARTCLEALMKLLARQVDPCMPQRRIPAELREASQLMILLA